jgi:ubiquinone/menaquinone biosynthesis C-methylase UbiE
MISPIAKAIYGLPMPLYDRLFAALYDWGLKKTEEHGLSARREELLKEARGRVIEIGAGTGLNLDHYPRDLEQLVLTEPSAAMAAKLKDRLARDSHMAEVVAAPAEQLPYPDDYFDFAIATLVLCTVPDPAAALAEIRRVLKSDGCLLLIEHVRSDDPARAKWQDRLEVPWRIFGNGCHCNRETESLVRAAGLDFTTIEHSKLRKSPPLVRPLIQGRAEPAR